MQYLTEYEPLRDKDIYVMVNLGLCCNEKLILDWLEPIVTATKVPCRYWVAEDGCLSFFLLLCPNEKQTQKVLDAVRRFLRGRIAMSDPFL